ncbi:MAG: hypothetical protein ABEJ22_08800 [Haloferacaceae archaeon]
MSIETGRSAERFDHLLGLLADRRRRHAVAVLRAHDGWVSLPDVADEVAEMERGERLSNISPQAVLRVYCALYHTHVPLLESVDLVSYDQQTDAVRLLEDPPELASILDADPALTD